MHNCLQGEGRGGVGEPILEKYSVQNVQGRTKYMYKTPRIGSVRDIRIRTMKCARKEDTAEDTDVASQISDFWKKMLRNPNKNAKFSNVAVP